MQPPNPIMTRSGIDVYCADRHSSVPNTVAIGQILLRIKTHTQRVRCERAAHVPGMRLIPHDRSRDDLICLHACMPH